MAQIEQQSEALSIEQQLSIDLIDAIVDSLDTRIDSSALDDAGYVKYEISGTMADGRYYRAMYFEVEDRLHSQPIPGFKINNCNIDIMILGNAKTNRAGVQFVEQPPMNGKPTTISISARADNNVGADVLYSRYSTDPGSEQTEAETFESEFINEVKRILISEIRKRPSRRAVVDHARRLVRERTHRELTAEDITERDRVFRENP